MRLQNSVAHGNDNRAALSKQIALCLLLGPLFFLATGRLATSADPPGKTLTLSSLFAAEIDLASTLIPQPPDVAEQPASPTIEPLPDQIAIFGRLGDEEAKLEGDDLLFYEQTVKAMETEVRSADDELSYFWGTEIYTWAAPNLFHQPLYFEEVNLERYGTGARRIFQTPVSATHFFANIAVLPYHVASLPPRKRIYTLGHYRPGDCVPHRFHRAPFSVKGFAAQGAAAAGVVLIP